MSRKNSSSVPLHGSYKVSPKIYSNENTEMSILDSLTSNFQKFELIWRSPTSLRKLRDKKGALLLLYI